MCEQVRKPYRVDTWDDTYRVLIAVNKLKGS